MEIALKNILPFMIPIIAIIMGIGVAMLAIWTDYNRKREMFELHHKERLLAIERGMEVPQLPPELFQEDGKATAPSDLLRRGLIWMLVGIALMVAIALNRSLAAAAWGLIPAAVGLAYLISYRFAGPKPPSAPGSGKA